MLLYKKILCACLRNNKIFIVSNFIIDKILLTTQKKFIKELKKHNLEFYIITKNHEMFNTYLPFVNDRTYIIMPTEIFKYYLKINYEISILKLINEIENEVNIYDFMIKENIYFSRFFVVLHNSINGIYVNIGKELIAYLMLNKQTNVFETKFNRFIKILKKKNLKYNIKNNNIIVLFIDDFKKLYNTNTYNKILKKYYNYINNIIPIQNTEISKKTDNEEEKQISKKTDNEEEKEISQNKETPSGFQETSKGSFLEISKKVDFKENIIESTEKTEKIERIYKNDNMDSNIKEKVEIIAYVKKIKYVTNDETKNNNSETNILSLPLDKIHIEEINETPYSLQQENQNESSSNDENLYHTEIPEQEKNLCIYNYANFNNINVNKNLIGFWIYLQNIEEILVDQKLLEYLIYYHKEIDIMDPNYIIKKEKIVNLPEDILYILKYSYVNYIEILKKHNIKYMVKKELFKTLILETIDFKESMIIFLGKKFLALEKLFYMYNTYLISKVPKDIKISKYQQKLNDLIEINFNLENKIKNIEQNLKKTYIYIITSKDYSIKNIFKIGQTVNLKNRLSAYNSGRPDDDKLYYVFYEKVYEANEIEKKILLSLDSYKDNKNKEILIIDFNILKNTVKQIINESNSIYEYKNNIKLKSIEEGLQIPKEEENIDAKLYKILENCDNSINRKDLIAQISNINNSKEIWKYIKNKIQWVSSTIPIVINNKKIYIIY